MSNAWTAFAVAILAALASAIAPGAEAQPPIRIGATLSQTGVNATVGQVLLRGYQLCVKHMNDKGGVLGRKLELILYDDGSNPATAVRLYEKLITQDKVDLVLGPYGAQITEAVADVTEKHKMPMVASAGAATATYRKGRKFIFSMLSPSEVNLEGLIDLAVKKGLKTVALIHADELFGRAATQGAIELAKKKGLQVVFADAYPLGTTDFSATMTRVRATNPDALGVATGVLEDGVGITRQLRVLDANPRIVGLTPVGASPTLYEALGREAEFVYAASHWVPELVEVRAGGLIPIARQYPGAREFVESVKREFPGATPAGPALTYAACQILVEAIRRAGSLSGAKVQDAISKLDHNTIYGRFRVDRDGAQIGHKMLLIQWQDGKRAIVWPEELAPGTPRFPTPPWSQRP